MNNPSSMGIKAIRQELESMGIGTKSFIEKSEFVNALFDARKERKAPIDGHTNVNISGDNMKVQSGTSSVGINIEMNNRDDASARCCAECGKEGGDSLKACKSCMLVEYCNASCQHKHWPKHKKLCKHRAAELRDEALFKDPPPKEECPICFLPKPSKLVCCVSLPPATTYSVPIYNFARANEVLAIKETETYYSCCGKTICTGCIHSFDKSGNNDKCPFCNAYQMGKTEEKMVAELMKRVEANDAASNFLLANSYQNGLGIQQDHAKAIELYVRAAELGCIGAHCHLADFYFQGGSLKKAKFHYEAAAMAGNELARCNIGLMELKSGNIERAIKHWTIAASAGHYDAMHGMRQLFEKGVVNRNAIDTTLTAYNNSCAEMRSEARDAFIQVIKLFP